MAKNNHYILLLWGTNFDEAAAGIFVSELREAGLQVKVVGLDGSQASGSHGLTLAADIPMSKALQIADKAICIVIPSASPGWTRIQDDPRVGDLLAQVHANHGKLILGVPGAPGGANSAIQSGSAAVSNATHPFCEEDVLVYPESSALPDFVRNLIHMLVVY